MDVKNFALSPCDSNVECDGAFTTVGGDPIAKDEDANAPVATAYMTLGAVSGLAKGQDLRTACVALDAQGGLVHTPCFSYFDTLCVSDIKCEGKP